MKRRAFALTLALCLALAAACTAADAPAPALSADAPLASPTAAPTPVRPEGNRGAIAVPTLATPTPQPPPADGPYGGVLVLANRGDPPSGFDTMRTSSIALHHVGGALFGPGNLVMRCRENLYLACPYLATTWTVDPGHTEWTFTLRDDVVWHDGTPFTAEDVEFWFDLALNGYEADGKVRAPAYFKGDLGEIESVEALPDNRVRIVLGERNRFFLDVLANPRLKFAHPKHLMEPRLQAGDVSVSPLDVGLIGLGPFVFEDYDRGTRIRVRRNDAYFETDNAGRPLPFLDGIDYVIIREPAAMDAAFRSGRLDGGARGFGHYLTVERRQGYDRDLGDTVFYAEMEGGMFRLAFNVLKEGPWQDPRVRRAIALWIDRDAAIPVALGGFGWTTPSLGPPNRFKDKAYVVWPTFDREPSPSAAPRPSASWPRPATRADSAWATSAAPARLRAASSCRPSSANSASICASSSLTRASGTAPAPASTSTASRAASPSSPSRRAPRASTARTPSPPTPTPSTRTPGSPSSTASFARPPCRSAAWRSGGSSSATSSLSRPTSSP